MYKHNDLSGMKAGSLSVIGQAGRTKDRHILWECICDCGNVAVVSSKDLISGYTKSCGCLQKKTVSAAKRIHGDRDARLYGVWKTMKKRCENENCRDFRWYGAKGVSVCEEWQDYGNFKAWAMANGYDQNAIKGACTIDRIDPCGNYEPSNCRWVSMEIQAKNRRKR